MTSQLTLNKLAALRTDTHLGTGLATLVTSNESAKHSQNRKDWGAH